MGSSSIKGKNDKYPKKIEYWKYGLSVPEWLSDMAKIQGIDGDTGEAILDLKFRGSGGFDILESSGQSILVRVQNRDDYVCFGKLESGEDWLFPLRESQFEILYGE